MTVKTDRHSSKVPSAVFQRPTQSWLCLLGKGLYVGIDHRRVEHISFRKAPLAPLGTPMLSF